MSVIHLLHRGYGLVSAMAKFLSTVVCLLSLSVSAMAVADKSELETPAFDSAAHNRVQQVTNDLIVTITEKGELINTSPEDYFSAVGEVLAPVVDFKFISKVVMGRYGKAATPEQKQKFEQAFRRGLVETYARGMAGYADQDIKILPPEGDVSAQRRVSVRQQVRGEQGDSHLLAYTMARSKKTGEWMLINVVMDGINLGKTFRSQFEQAVKKNSGDIDAVIDQWLSSEA